VRYRRKQLCAVNRLLQLPFQSHVMKTLVHHCHTDVCTTRRGLSAGCRASWFRLQHHATVMTSNCVTICSRKFPPTVSKHCEHRHNAIPKTIKAIGNTKEPCSCDIQGAASSAQHHGSLVHCHSIIFSDASLGLPTYNKLSVTQFTVVFSTVIANLLRILHKMSHCQHKQ